MFCDQCGQRLELQNNFCSRCGNKIKPVDPSPSVPVPTHPQPAPPQSPQPAPQPYAPPVQPPVYQPTDDETAVFVLSATRKLSALKAVACNVVFMRGCVVLAHLKSALQKAESARVSQEIKASGKGFFKGSAEMMRFWANYAQQYYTMPVSAILAQDASNMALPYAAIDAVYFKGYSETVDYSDASAGSTVQGRLRFSLTGGEVIKLTHNQRHTGAVKQTLSELFGSKLKYRK